MIQTLNFNLFGDYKNLEATPERISQLLNEMIKKGINVMPGTFQQINPGLGMKKFERMKFINQKDNFSISFNVDSIHINSTIIDDKSYNLKSNINKFVYNINKVLSSLDSLPEFMLSGSRASLVINVLHENQRIKPLNEIFKEFNNNIPFYEPDETFEWNSRAVKRKKIKILDQEEEFNIVSEVMRTQGEIDREGEKSVFDTINTMIDINTVYENTEERINSDFSKEFLEKSVGLFSSHYEAIEVKLNVG